MFCNIKERIDEPIVKQIISAAVFDSSEEGLNQWAAKIRSCESLQLYGWIQGEEIVGVCSFEAHSDFVEILTIAVAESVRGCGIGGSMIRDMQENYKLRIEAETDDDAVKFYHKCGFETTAILKHDTRRWTCVLRYEFPCFSYQ